MLSEDKQKIKIFGVFNSCTETTIPLENFVNLDPSIFEKHILSFYQGQNELKELMAKAYLEKNLWLHGLKIKWFCSYNVLRLVSILIKEKPHIIHVHHSFSGLMLSVLGSIVSKAKIVTTVHSNYRFYTKMQRLIFLLMYTLSDLIICNSNNTRKSIERIKQKFFPRVQTEVIYNGVDLQYIRNVKRDPVFHSVSVDHFVIGTVGRLVPAKDYRTLIKAFSLFNKKVDNSELILVGDGKLRKQLEQLSNKLGLKERVIFCGFIPRKKVYEKLRSFNLFVISSKWEGFCNAMVEAMMARIPVLASNIQPLPEVLGRDNGMFFTAGDIDELYEKMIYCYNNHENIKSLAIRAFDFASKRYSLRLSVQQHENTYLELSKDQVAVS